jgi:hypothetical protein
LYITCGDITNEIKAKEHNFRKNYGKIINISIREKYTIVKEKY